MYSIIKTNTNIKETDIKQLKIYSFMIFIFFALRIFNFLFLFFFKVI